MKSLQIDRRSRCVLNRRSFLGGLAASGISAAPAYSRTAGYLKGAGDFRQISFISAHTGEWLNSIYWIDGNYISEAIDEINFVMRDWRTSDVKAIDLRTINILSASAKQLETEEPFTLLSGYRSPKTNAMLRRKSAGVAKYSLHMLGQAVDLTLKTRTVSEIFKAALACRGGGVGKYSSSNFVHIDCGKIRSWGSGAMSESGVRAVGMTAVQLAGLQLQNKPPTIQGRTTMYDATIIDFTSGDPVTDPLTDLLRKGARELLKAAVEVERDGFLAEFAARQRSDGRAAVVRSGYHPPRAVQTGIGPVTVKVPKVMTGDPSLLQLFGESVYGFLALSGLLLQRHFGDKLVGREIAQRRVRSVFVVILPFHDLGFGIREGGEQGFVETLGLMYQAHQQSTGTIGPRESITLSPKASSTYSNVSAFAVGPTKLVRMLDATSSTTSKCSMTRNANMPETGCCRHSTSKTDSKKGTKKVSRKLGDIQCAGYIRPNAGTKRCSTACVMRGENWRSGDTITITSDRTHRLETKRPQRRAGRLSNLRAPRPARLPNGPSPLKSGHGGVSNPS